MKDVSSTPGIGEFYLDGYFVDKVFGLPAGDAEIINDIEKDPCGP